MILGGNSKVKSEIYQDSLTWVSKEARVDWRKRRYGWDSKICAYQLRYWGKGFLSDKFSLCPRFLNWEYPLRWSVLNVEGGMNNSLYYPSTDGSVRKPDPREANFRNWSLCLPLKRCKNPLDAGILWNLNYKLLMVWIRNFLSQGQVSSDLQPKLFSQGPNEL